MFHLTFSHIFSLTLSPHPIHVHFHFYFSAVVFRSLISSICLLFWCVFFLCCRHNWRCCCYCSLFFAYAFFRFCFLVNEFIFVFIRHSSRHISFFNFGGFDTRTHTNSIVILLKEQDDGNKGKLNGKKYIHDFDTDNRFLRWQTGSMHYRLIWLWKEHCNM